LKHTTSRWPEGGGGAEEHKNIYWTEKKTGDAHYTHNRQKNKGTQTKCLVFDPLQII
jgi:hypothetical protein